MGRKKTDGVKTRSSVVSEHDLAPKKARLSSNSSDLKFRCSFCPERFPSLLSVRDHTRNEHQEQNERRSIERLNIRKDKRSYVAELGQGPRWIKTLHNDKIIPIYRCIECTFASVSYDLMIEHCQHHIIDEASDDIIITPITTIETTVIDEKVDVDTATYKEYNDNNVNSYMFIDCDYKLLKTDKWPGIFDTMTKHEIDKINCKSIYYFTRIIHFTSESKVSSAPFMLFKCMKCMKYIYPYSIVAHIQENTCSKQLKGFPCYKCDIPFLTEKSMYLHHKTHQVANISYTTISFNYDDDKHINTILLKAAGIHIQCGPRENEIKQQTSCIEKSQFGVKTCQSTKDARTIIIQGKNKSKESSEIADKDKVATIYKCQCELCFHTLEPLLKHIENCTSDLTFKQIICSCSLVFDEQQYEFHSSLHGQGFTKLNVKKVTVCDEKVIALNMQHEFKDDSGPIEKNTKIVTDEDIKAGKTNDITAKVSKKHESTEVEKPTIDEIHRKAISDLTTTILNLPKMFTRVSDSKKFVKRQGTTSTSTTDPKSDDSINKSVKISGGSVSMTVTQTVQEEANEEGNIKQDETGETKIAQTGNNIDILKLGTDQQVISNTSYSPNNIINSDSSNTEENQCMVDTAVEVELTLTENNTIMAEHEEHHKTLNQRETQKKNFDNNQETVVTNVQSKKHNECEDATTEDELRDVECNTSQKSSFNEPEVKDVAPETKIYTEDELLNEDTSMYFDANSLSSYDEDPTLLDDDD